jgi:hypothetical protein
VERFPRAVLVLLRHMGILEPFPRNTVTVRRDNRGKRIAKYLADAIDDVAVVVPAPADNTGGTAVVLVGLAAAHLMVLYELEP